MEKKHNIVYKTTNLVNQNIYIGIHSTNDLHDGYMGSGTVLMAAMKKHGKENFSKTVLFDFPTRKEALNKEREIVNVDFVCQNNVYNIKEGGCGNSSYDTLNLWKNPEYREKVIASSFARVWHDKDFQERRIEAVKRPESREKMSKSAKRVGALEHIKESRSKHSKEMWENPEHQQNMSKKTKAFMTGTVFVHNDTLQRNTRIKETELSDHLEKGWKRGLKKEYSKKRQPKD